MVMPRIGQGTLLQLGDGGAPENFTSVAKLTEIGEFGGNSDDMEITNHDSLYGVREFIRGLSDPGEISFTGIWIGDPSQIKVYDGAFQGIVPNSNFKVILPASMGTATFSGFIAGFTINPQLEDRIEFTGRIRISGTFTLTVP